MFFKDKKNKNIIFIKEVRPEMTQCRIIQVDKKRKEKNESSN